MDFSNTTQLQTEINVLAGIRKRTLKPVMSIMRFSTPQEMRRARELGKKYQKKGIPTYPSVERGARALKNALDYYSRKSIIDT